MNINIRRNKKSQLVEKEKKLVINEIANDLESELKDTVENFFSKAGGE